MGGRLAYCHRFIVIRDVICIAADGLETQRTHWSFCEIRQATHLNTADNA